MNLLENKESFTTVNSTLEINNINSNSSLIINCSNSK